MPNVIIRGPSTLVTCDGDSASAPRVKTWTLLELQGELMNLDTLNDLSIASHEGQKENEENSDPKYFNLVGDLHFDLKSGNPLFIVGHHLLTGRREKLTKPYVAMKRVTQKNLAKDSAVNEVEGNDAVYEVYAIAREKLIFNQRPKPIIASSSIS